MAIEGPDFALSKMCAAICAGISGRLQHYRLTAVVGPREGDVSILMRLLADRAPAGSILSGSCRAVLGDTFSGCRSVIGYATSVSNPPN